MNMPNSSAPSGAATDDTTWSDFSSELHVPPPANLPTNGEDGNATTQASNPSSRPTGAAAAGGGNLNSSPLTGLDEPEAQPSLLFPPAHANRGMWQVTDQPGIDLFLAGPRVWARLQQVYVILFGVGERDTEGIYSLRAFGADGVAHETIISFECEEDAIRWAR